MVVFLWLFFFFFFFFNLRTLYLWTVLFLPYVLLLILELFEFRHYVFFMMISNTHPTYYLHNFSGASEIVFLSWCLLWWAPGYCELKSQTPQTFCKKTCTPVLKILIQQQLNVKSWYFSSQWEKKKTKKKKKKKQFKTKLRSVQARKSVGKKSLLIPRTNYFVRFKRRMRKNIITLIVCHVCSHQEILADFNEFLSCFLFAEIYVCKIYWWIVSVILLQ